jgi:alpha-mannosidase
VIVRLYEAWGRPCTARVRTTLPTSRAYLCDLLERDHGEVTVTDGVIVLELTPFKILTLKLQP